MLLKNLIENLKDIKIINPCNNLEITSLCYDSRKVEKDNLFIALKGEHFDGADFLEEALNNGAISLCINESKMTLCLVPRLPRAESRGPSFVVHSSVPLPPLIFTKDTRELMPKLAAKFYEFPSKYLKIIGITGTNGKTTTCYLLEKILREAGFKTALLGTVINKVNEKIIPMDHTTVESVDLQKTLAQAKDKGVDYVIMEVSSHGIDQKRVQEVDFYLKALTNITPDHLDYHHNFEAYRQVKLHWLEQGSSLVIMPQDYENKIVPPTFSLLGKFNFENAKLAIVIAQKLGIKEKFIEEGLIKSKPPQGRFQNINCGQDFLVIIDYAHTPDALKNVLSACRDLLKSKKNARIIAVFGCGGDRDRLKRPLMGEIAAQISDVIILTSDNPRREEPEKIIGEIEKGIDRSLKYEKIVDRKKAIEKALYLARKDDLVLIAGKGHEKVQIFKDKVIPFSDEEEVRKILTRL